MISRTLLLVSGLALALLGSRLAAAPMPVVPNVSVAKDARQEEMLRSLHRDTGRLVLSECPDLEHRSRNAARDRPLSEVLPAVTADYHLHALVDPRKLLFVRRFWDPREEPKIPIAEIQAIVADVHRILDPLSPHFEGSQNAFQRREFYRSLTPDQIAAARKEQLTYRALSPDQRRQWDLLTAAHAFNSQERELRKSLAFFKDWNRCDAHWSTAQEMEVERRSLMFRYPIQTPEGFDRWEFEIYREVAEAEPPPVAPSAPSLEQLATGTHAPTRCDKEHTQLTQPTTLAEIVAAVARENQVSIRVPEYARERRYYLFSKGSTGDDVLRALADINGWEVHEVGRGKFALERPRLTMVRDFSEFHRVIRSRFSPVVRLLLESEPIFNDPYSARHFRAWSLIMPYLERHHPPPAGFRIAALAPEQQVRLANLLLEGIGLRAPLAYLINRKPAAWLAAREQGFFKLLGEVGPGKHPMLEFHVLRERNGDRLTWDCWGWLVNSSTLGSKVRPGSVPDPARWPARIEPSGGPMDGRFLAVGD